MKRILVSLVILTTISMASCTKDYTCACTTITTSGNGTTTENTDTVFTKATKTEAESKCNSIESSGNSGGYTWDTTCGLK